ncbi:MAG: histidine kinase, partial [Desulfobacterales bacterium]|nr:histidine kinase [Desulfobacterales bacterium]
ELQPKLDRLLSYIMLLPLGLLISLPFFSYAAIGKIISDVGLLVLVSVILTGIRGLVIGYRPARFFLFGWGFFLLGGLIYALNFKGIFPYPFIGNNAAQAGSGIEMLFLSVAIADRVKYLLAQMQRVEKKRQKQLKVISHKLVQAEEKERRRIAEILHDSIGQTILATRWEVERLISNEMLSSGQASKLMRFLDNTIQETRTLTKELYPKELQVFGLKKSLESMADTFSRQHGLTIRIHTEFESKLADENLNIVIYRSVSELLINAVKHAGAKLVEIDILVQNDLIYVIVQDDGVGFDYRINSDSDIRGFGLFKIQETLSNLQGSLKVGYSRTGGAQITLTIPMSEIRS